jgi:hypothetical protein
VKIRLGDILHCRSGDKGDTSNISVVPNDPADYEWLREELTEERVAEVFGPLVKGTVTRYEVPGIHAFNFVLTEALGGGVSRSLCQDIHGKSWGVLIARMELERPEPS